MSGSDSVLIVGIGASAGGLEATNDFLSHVEPGLGCAYVVLQHMSPDHRSMLVEILGRATKLTVVPAVDGVRVVADFVYVIPAGSNADFADGCIRLSVADPGASPKPSINRFFVSLASEREDGAIGIVLSGTGSDGTGGLKAIVANGGTAFVQLPDSAAFDGMPSSAIDAGFGSFVGTPEEIAAHLRETLGSDSGADRDGDAADELRQLLDLITEHVGCDFTGYKVATLVRRVRRRQDATGKPLLADYIAWASNHPEELEALSHEMLISVTSFFRDSAAFDALNGALEQIISAKKPDAPIRLWVAGCATGEEAYSLAIMLDQLTDIRRHREVVVFATDIDDRALAIARRGIYPESSVNVLPQSIIDKYFQQVDGGYEADKRLRDMILFARHNLVDDPPFLRLDAVSCRNVLIYFDTALQARVLSAFHFGLNSDGVLLIGKSEGISPVESLFAMVNRAARLFMKIPTQGRTTLKTRLRSSAHPRSDRGSLPEGLLASVAKAVDALVIRCDLDGNIQYTAGEVEGLLTFPSGGARLTLNDSLASELRGEVLTMLHRFKTTGEPQRSRQRRVGDRIVHVLLESVANVADSSIVIVIVAQERSRTVGAPPEDGSTAEVQYLLENELLSTQEHLHVLLEEMTTSNEEMQALNEEAQAANEELQAASEEMEAANEELQAANEELVSLNEEYNNKAGELTRLSDEYVHLYNTLPLSVLVLDSDRRLARFNKAAADVLNLTLGALSQPLAALGLPKGLVDLDTLIDQAAQTVTATESTASWKDRTGRVTVTPVPDDRGAAGSFIVTLVDMTEIVTTKQEVTDSENRLQALLQVSSVMYAIKAMDGSYLYANQPFVNTFELSESPTGKTDFDIHSAALAAEMWGADLEALRSQVPVERQHVLDANSGKRTLASRHQAIRGRQGSPTWLIFEGIDVTAQREAEDSLRVTANVFEQATEAIIITDRDGEIQSCNAAFESITGYASDEVVGQRLATFFASDNSDWSKELNQSGRWHGEIVHSRKTGERYSAWVTISKVEDLQGGLNHYVAVFSDISQIKDVQQRTEFLSTHDELTRLPNRALLMELLDDAIVRRTADGRQVALLFIDIDRFKNVNDTLGHAVGDELLRRAADRIRGILGDSESVARFGGDEFVAIAIRRSRDDIDKLAASIREVLSQTYSFDTHDIFTTASVGIAFYERDVLEGQQLLSAADSAMYHAKSAGRNRVSRFHPAIRDRRLHDGGIERALRRSLYEGGFSLVFQPIYRVSKDREMAGLEALLRWTDSVIGTTSPAEFIPIAERCGLIAEIDRTVRDLLLQQVSQWRADGLDVPPVSMNVSPWSLREPGFATQLVAATHEAGIPGGKLRVEITEGALVQNEESVQQNLTILNESHIEISIDDFGTGYSSLAYLHRLPLSQLKVDRSFTAGIGLRDKGDAIVEAILGMAKTLGLATVAEGVETEEQWTWLERHNCDYTQGFLQSRPLEPAQIAAKLPKL